MIPPLDESRTNGQSESSRSPYDEVERLKREPVRFRCLGMSVSLLLLLVLLIWLAWRLLKR